MHVLVPLKRLDRAKTRLAALLPPADRAALMRALVANALRESLDAAGPGLVTLVSSDPAAPALAAEHGAACFDDRGLPWNDALAAAMAETVDDEVCAIVSADLPLLTAADVAALVAATPPGGGAAIARATDAGTNAVAMRPTGAFATCFGVPGSAARHAELARAAGLEAVVLDRPGTAIDLDSPEDVARFLDLAPPGELRELVASLAGDRRIAV